MAERVTEDQLVDWREDAIYFGELPRDKVLDILGELGEERERADDMAGRYSCMRQRYIRLAELGDSSYRVLLLNSRDWRRELDEAQAKLSAVRELHHRYWSVELGTDVCAHCSRQPGYVDLRLMSWPCDTIKALEQGGDR